jgi:hypothetical protein
MTSRETRGRGRRPQPNLPLPRMHQDTFRATEAYQAQTTLATREVVESLEEDVCRTRQCISNSEVDSKWIAWM